MPLPHPPTILLIGQDVALGYLLARFAEHSGYQSRVSAEMVAGPELAALGPALVIFQSLDLLARSQGNLAELARLETPILVCAAAAEEATARDLGADGCLLHPFTFGDFQAALATVAAPGVNPVP